MWELMRNLCPRRQTSYIWMFLIFAAPLPSPIHTTGTPDVSQKSRYSLRTTLWLREQMVFLLLFFLSLFLLMFYFVLIVVVVVVFVNCNFGRFLFSSPRLCLKMCLLWLRDDIYIHVLFFTLYWRVYFNESLVLFWCCVENFKTERWDERMKKKQVTLET